MRPFLRAQGGDLSPQPQLSFQFVNSAGGTTTTNVVYVTDDTTYNQLALVISLTAGAITLAPGTIPDPSAPPATGTTLYLDLSGLALSSAVWDGMTFAGDGWKFQKFGSQGVVGMTPTKPLALTSGTSGSLAITIAGLTVPSALSDPQIQLYVSYFNVPGVQGQYASFAVALQNRPDGPGKDLTQVLTVSLSANGIVNSILPLLQAQNLFSLQLSSKQSVQVVAGPDTELVVGFVYGAAKDSYGFGALTDLANGKLIALTAGTNAAQWRLTANLDGQSPSWTLQPPDGAPIVGTGAQAVVAFDFANVLTTYQAGPTMMLVSYANVPGYQDGTFALILDKVAHAQLQAMSVTPNPTVFSGGTADVTVQWTAAAARGLELTQNFQSKPVTGQTSAPATLDAELTTFGLTATGAPGTVPNVDYRSVQAIALPVINSFTGAPTEIFSGSLAHDAMFAWAVDSPAGVTLSSTGGAFSGQQFDATGGTAVSIDQPQMITLAPTTAAEPLALTRRLVISAFTPTPKSYPLSFTPAAVAAAPAGPFIVMAGPGTNLTVADTINYATQATVAIGHAPSALAFSPDGGTLATANTDGTVTIVAVSLDASGSPVFGAPTTIKLGATPQQLVFSPRGPRLFATTDADDGTPGQVVSLLGSQGSYRLEGMVVVGVAPRGLCLDAAGMRLFVANSGDDTVSMIGLTGAGGLGAATTIPSVTGGPTGIAATPSGKQLLVSCATAGTVVVLQPDHPATGQRNTLTVGGTPGPIALTPTGAYAFVANHAGSLALIGCWGLPAAAAVLGSPIAVGAQPTAVSMSPDGLQVLAAVNGGFSLVTLATYQAAGAPVAVPNRPTSVEVTPAGDSVFLWHDASIPAPSPSPGILVYTPVTGNLGNLLADKKVLRCVASPDPLDHAAFAIVAGDPALYLIATDRLTASAFALGLPTGTTPVALAVSGEGKTVFVIAADAQVNLSLVVVQAGSGSWTVTDTVALYQSMSFNRILLRATPDASTLFLVDTAAATVRPIVKTGATYALSPTTITGDASALDLAILPDGTTAYVLNAGTSTGSITVIDVASLGSYVAAIPQPFVHLTALQPSPDGRRLFATDPNAAALRMLDPRSLRILQTIPLAARPSAVAGASGLAVMPDGSKLFTANTVSQNLSITEQIQMGTSTVARELRTALLAAAPYQGLFMRHDIDDTPATPTSGWSASPDIIPNLDKLIDHADLISAAGYANPFSSNVNVNSLNYVYARGLNTTAAAIKSRAYFYYTKGSLALWPANWSTVNVNVNDAKPPINWVDIQAPAVGNGSNGVGAALVPYQWTPPPFPQGTDHYCIIGWVDNSATPQPPDFAAYSQFATFDDLVSFVLSHHNLAWRNTNDIFVAPPDLTYRTGISLKEGGGTVQITITFPDCPPDGDIAIQLQGTDKTNTIDVPRSSLQNYQGGYTSNLLHFPSLFETSVQVQHWPGATPVPITASINIVANVQTAPSLQRDIERLYRRQGRRSPYRVLAGNPFPTVVMGSTFYNLKFGHAATAAFRKEQMR